MELLTALESNSDQKNKTNSIFRIHYINIHSNPNNKTLVFGPSLFLYVHIGETLSIPLKTESAIRRKFYAQGNNIHTNL